MLKSTIWYDSWGKTAGEKEMRRIISVMLCLILIVNISGCGCVVPFLRSDPNFKTPEEQTVEYSENLMKVLMEKDEVAFKELLCQDILDNDENIDNEIHELINFIEGDILSYDPPRGGAMSETTTPEEGAIERLAKCNLENITTSEGKTYKIGYFYGMINKEHPELLGIVSISILIDSEESDSDSKYQDRYDLNHW